MNPYAPTETKPEEEQPLPAAATRSLWPLLLLNIAFLLCAVSVVILPGLGTWLLVSVLIVFSIGGWSLARSLRQEI